MSTWEVLDRRMFSLWPLGSSKSRNLLSFFQVCFFPYDALSPPAGENKYRKKKTVQLELLAQFDYISHFMHPETSRSLENLWKNIPLLTRSWRCRGSSGSSVWAAELTFHVAWKKKKRESSSPLSSRLKSSAQTSGLRFKIPFSWGFSHVELPSETWCEQWRTRNMFHVSYFYDTEHPSAVDTDWAPPQNSERVQICRFCQPEKRRWTASIERTYCYQPPGGVWRLSYAKEMSWTRQPSFIYWLRPGITGGVFGSHIITVSLAFLTVSTTIW